MKTAVFGASGLTGKLLVLQALEQGHQLRKPYNNMKKLESYLQSVYDIDWIIVRPSQMTDTLHTGVYRLSPGYAPKGGSKISRADLAQFILKPLNVTEWLRKTPTLTY